MGSLRDIGFILDLKLKMKEVRRKILFEVEDFCCGIRGFYFFRLYNFGICKLKLDFKEFLKF